ncbi:MAG: VWA domain-containing protein, partial [Gammaproteobacteria bacterium]
MKRRPISTFSLSFIDAILCGFGAAVLLFLTVNANSLAERDQRTDALRSAVTRLQHDLLHARKRLVVLKNTLQETDDELERAEGLADRIISD